MDMSLVFPLTPASKSDRSSLLHRGLLGRYGRGEEGKESLQEMFFPSLSPVSELLFYTVKEVSGKEVACADVKALQLIVVVSDMAT